MKKYFFVYAALCAALCIGLALFALMPSVAPEQDIDVIAINEIAKEAAKHWQMPSALDSATYLYQFVLLDNEGNLRYASHEDMPDNLAAAIRRGFVSADVVVGASVEGKALVETSPGDMRNQLIGRLRLFVFVAFALLCILNAAFFWALHRAMISPFTKIQVFAHKITTGQ
ncbi:MAG: hypothetical protein LBH09_07180, partial [Peptococcaceae bacterium]|nr:hypothetical protein [Peptococcaceae bacterium]